MKVGIYVRVSSQHQAEKWSLPAQRDTLAKHAEAKGWTWELYDEGGVSAESITARPVFQKLLLDAKEHKIGGILVIEMERLCRATDLFDWATITATCKAANCRIFTPSQEFDLRVAEDNFLADLFGILSKREKMKLLERTARGRAKSKDAGKYQGGTAPYGYKYDPYTKKIMIDEEWRPIIQYIFSSNDGCDKMRVKLRKRGIRVSNRAVSRIRQRILYCGLTHNTKGEIIDADWEGIITYEEYLKQQKMTESRTNGNSPLAKRLLTGIIRCAGCGGRVVGVRAGGGHNGYDTPTSRLISYVCKNTRFRRGDLSDSCLKPGSIRAFAVEPIFLDAAMRYFGDEDRLRHGYGVLKKALRGHERNDQVSGARRRLQGQRKRRERLLDALEAGTLDPAAIRERMTKVEDEIKSTETWIASQKTPKGEGLRMPPFSFFRKLVKSFPEAPIDRRRGILHEFVEEAVLDFPERLLTIRWKFGGETIRYQVPSLRGFAYQTIVPRIKENMAGYQVVS